MIFNDKKLAEFCQSIQVNLDTLQKAVNNLAEQIKEIQKKQTIEFKTEIDTLKKDIETMQAKQDNAHQTLDTLKQNQDVAHQTLDSLKQNQNNAHQTLDTLKQNQDVAHKTLDSLKQKKCDDNGVKLIQYSNKKYNSNIIDEQKEILNYLGL